MDLNTVKSYNQIKMCMCVEWGGYLWWLILILHCSFKTYLSFELGNNCKKTWAIFFFSFLLLFSGGHQSTHCFDTLDTCPFLRDNNKDFGPFIWWKPKWNIFGVSSKCRSKTFWMEQVGMVWVVVGVVRSWF
jgi:hypothetical protein